MAGDPAWAIEGDYFENCNCDVVCPCLFSAAEPMSATPTQGACEVMIAFHVDRGSYGDVGLDDLNVVAVGRSPGPMADGDMLLALYLDERADERQQGALTAIFSGAAGGPMGLLAPLVGEVLGVRSAPIEYRVDGRRRECVMADTMRMAVRAIPSVDPEGVLSVTGAHPFAMAGLALAVGEEGSTFSDHDLSFDNSGKNGHYARISWSNG